MEVSAAGRKLHNNVVLANKYVEEMFALNRITEVRSSK